MSRKVLWGSVAGALLIAGYLSWVDGGSSANFAVGDCVSLQSPGGRLDTVGCGGGQPAGVYQVLAEYRGDDSNQCDAVPATTKSFVVSEPGGSSLVLCTGAAGPTPAAK